MEKQVLVKWDTVTVVEQECVMLDKTLTKNQIIHVLFGFFKLKKRKCIIIISMITTVLVFLSCNAGDNRFEKTFHLRGKISGDFTGLIYLEFLDKIDSVEVKDGAFSFKGFVKNPSEAFIMPNAPNSSLPMTVGGFMIENSEISLYTRYQKRKSNGMWIDFLDIDSVKGSKTQILKNTFQDKMENTFYKTTEDSIKTKLLYQNLYEFISTHPKSVLSGLFLFDLATFFDLLTVKQLKRLYQLLDKNYQRLEYLDGIRAFIEQKELLIKGEKPPLLILPDKNENLINYSSIQADFLLLEFWASWCGPCRQQNPELKEVYEKFNYKGFEILGISIDQNKDQWLKAIEQDKIGWKHVIDASQKSMDRFRINAIPFNLLLDKDGKIVKININTEELQQLLNLNL
jgi:thiol-disulfide isomerase/thioredoxin